jgi:hypothetical protein
MTITPDILIANAQNYASSTIASAASAMQGAMNVANQIGQGVIADPDGITLKVEPPAPGDPGEVPAYTGAHYEATEFSGTAPVITDVGTLSLPSSPGSAPSIPSITLPNKPTGTADTSLLANPPVLRTTFTTPLPPDIDVAGIEKPTMIDLVIPPAPVYDEPEFLGVRPSAAPTAPTNLDVTMRTQYSTISPVMQDAVNQQIDAFLDREFPEFRTAMAKIEERLATYMEGGTALSPAIENAIYNRTLDKTNADARRASDEAWTKAARAGFTIPPATLLAQLQDVDQERRDGNARAATEIAIKQAELEQNNLQFAVTQSANLRKVAIDSALAYYSGLVQINGQALEYARSVVDAVVKSYDIAAKYTELQVRIYESEASVYKTRLEGALAKFDAYKAEISALEAQANIDVAKVNVYRAQLEGVKTEVEVYQAQIEAVNSQISVEKMKVELYQARVSSYVSQVNGYTAQWQGFEAAVRGEVAKVQAAGEQVQAYSARVNAYQAEVNAKATELEARMKVNTQKMQVYESQVQAYTALENAKVTATNLEISSFLSTLKAFDSKANAISEKSRAEVSIYQVAQQAFANAAQIQYQYTANRNATEVARAQAVGNIAGKIGATYAAVAEASLAGMNSLAAATQTTTA